MIGLKQKITDEIYFEALVPSIPSWMFVVALVAFMTAFNLRSLKSVANFNTVIVVLQVVLIAVILGMVVYGVFEGEGAGTLASTRPFWSGDAHVIPMITGATNQTRNTCVRRHTGRQYGNGGEDQRTNLECFTCNIQHDFRL